MTRVGIEAGWGGHGTLEVEAEGCQGAVVAPGTVSFPFTCTHSHSQTAEKTTQETRSSARGCTSQAAALWKLKTRLTVAAYSRPSSMAMAMAAPTHLKAGTADLGLGRLAGLRLVLGLHLAE